MRDILTKTIKEVLLSDNVVAEAEVGISCIAARPRCSRRVDTACKLLHPVDNVVQRNICLGARVGPIPTICVRQLGHSSLKTKIGVKG